MKKKTKVPNKDKCYFPSEGEVVIIHDIFGLRHIGKDTLRIFQEADIGKKVRIIRSQEDRNGLISFLAEPLNGDPEWANDFNIFSDVLYLGEFGPVKQGKTWFMSNSKNNLQKWREELKKIKI